MQLGTPLVSDRSLFGVCSISSSQISCPAIFVCESLGHFSLDHVFGRKEGNVLFNDALNTFYLRL